MFMKAGYKVLTPEDAQKEIKKQAVINWVVFFSILLLVTIGVLEVITRTTS